MKTMNILCTLLCTMLLATLPATAQNTDDNKNKAIIETTNGNHELNTDEISVIRFDGGKITLVQPWGETFFDRTLRSLSFLRPNPNTLRLTATTSIGTEGGSNRAQTIDGGKLKSTWESGDKVYVYANASTNTSIGTLTPKSEDYGNRTATLSGDIATTGLANGQTLYFSTKPRPYDFSSQDGTVESLFYCTAEGTVTIDGANASVSDLNFSRPIAIVKFTLKDKAGNLLNASNLTISASSNKLVKGVGWSGIGAKNYHSGYTADNGSSGSLGPNYGNLVDGNTGTKWCDNPSNGVWTIEFHTASTVLVDGYTLTTGDDTQDWSQRNPKSWTLEAKANSGDTWAVIDTRTNNTDMPAENKSSVDFNVAVPGDYQYFRLKVSAVQAGDLLQLSEMQLFSFENKTYGAIYGDITITPASATNELTVALRNESDAADTYTLSANVGETKYYYEKSGVSFENGSYYAINVKMTNTPGKLPGEFTINADGRKVNFSQGNLQYQASTDTWCFAEHQYDMIGSGNANISDSYTGWIDLFGWGTGNNPTNSSDINSDYSTFTDWGANVISNGGNAANMWRTLTKDEWVYLFANHTKGWSTVNGVNGYVIRPDGVNTAVAASYTDEEWAVEEAAGSVFLPAANSRGGTTYNNGSWGDYWSSTPYNSNDAYYLYFAWDQLNPSASSGRFGGRSVRLVYRIPPFGIGTEGDPYLISSEADWNYLADKVSSGTNYSGKFFRQTANISVTTMVGMIDNGWKPFSGTYDGGGYTLNLNLNTTVQYTAPFQFIENATVKNVVTTGTVHSTGNHPAGLVGRTNGTCTIWNCRVSANVEGAQYMGGILGHCGASSTISIIGCVYSGTLTPDNGQYTGGIIGWGDGSNILTISDCLFAGSLDGSTDFHPIGITNSYNNTKYLSNTYYTLGANINDADYHSFVDGLTYKGKFARSITAGTDVTAVANAGAATEYNVSGITSYGTGIKYGDVLYAGNGEAISLTLSHAEAPTGFTFSQYTVTGGGTLANPTTNSPTLTMTDANQTINVEWVAAQQLQSIEIQYPPNEPVTFWYYPGENWYEAITNHPSENSGWAISIDDKVTYNYQYLNGGNEVVSSSAPIDPNETYMIDGFNP